MKKIKDLLGYGLLFGVVFYISGIVFANIKVDKIQKSLESLMRKQLGLNQLIINEPNQDSLKIKKECLDSTVNYLTANLGTEYYKTLLSWGYFMVDKEFVIPDTLNYPDFKLNDKKEKRIII